MQFLRRFRKVKVGDCFINWQNVVYKVKEISLSKEYCILEEVGKDGYILPKEYTEENNETIRIDELERDLNFFDENTLKPLPEGIYVDYHWGAKESVVVINTVKPLHHPCGYELNVNYQPVVPINYPLIKDREISLFLILYRKIENLSYKDQEGTVEYSLGDKVFHGKLLVKKGLITYESDTFEGLYDSFKEAVNDYVEFRKENNL